MKENEVIYFQSIINIFQLQGRTHMESLLSQIKSSNIDLEQQLRVG